ncbi:MAG: D-alanyl-D-alanine carboxypeptidase [Faecalimonas sp.]|nr:D-alanyl-D-alanine carboxypeptidase [Faecalimonas sp.]
MKSTNRQRRVFARRRKKRIAKAFCVILLVSVLACIAIAAVFIFANMKKPVSEYEDSAYQQHVLLADLPIDALCVAAKDVSNVAFEPKGEVHAAALFEIEEREVDYAFRIHERLYPASTTKLLTAYLALKYGNLEDMVTVSSTAVGVPLDSSRAGLCTGDQLSLETLLYGLMLPSGNDSAVAIAEHISGSVEEFTKLMNQEAAQLGATNTHFINPHGYHDENHYTCAYDLYLIMNACIQNETFLKLVSTAEYTTNITQKNGTYRTVTWKQSNQYVNGGKAAPQGVTVIGGKTGTTDQAGACLVLYEISNEGSPYISIIMGADNRPKLYQNMTDLLSTIAK